MTLLALLASAATALEALSSARYNATHEPPGLWWKVEQKRALRTDSLAQISVLRAAAVEQLRGAQEALAQEPPPPTGYEMPDWPRFAPHERYAAGPGDLADVVCASAESWQDDADYAAGLKQWAREYSILRDETAPCAA